MATIDLYKPIELHSVIMKTKPDFGFFRMFFKNSTKFWHTTNDFLVDFVEENNAVSVYANAKGDFQHVPDRGYSTNRYSGGSVKEKKVLTPDMLQNREAGDSNILGKQSYGSKKDRKIGEQQAELISRKDYLEEEQCSQALLTGTVTIIGEGISKTVDFGLAASHKITPAILWSNPTTAKPLTDLRGAITVMGDDGADTIAIHIMGFDAFDAFEATDQVTKQLDNRRFEKGSIIPENRTPKGAQFMGKFNGIGEVWAYQRTYEDKDGNAANFMDPEKVISISSSAQFEAHYGPIADFDAPNGATWAADFWPESVQVDGQTIENKLQSKPLMAALDTTGWTVMSPL